MVGINTHLANELVAEALQEERIPELCGYRQVRREVTYGEESSRVDFLLTGHASQPDCYVEVKNVTAAVEDGIALFPDAVSTRGSRHLRELAVMKAGGYRSVLLLCVQREDVREVRPADAIDPLYGQTLRKVAAAGVEVLAYGARVSRREVVLDGSLAVSF